MEESSKPDPNMVRLFRLYLLIAVTAFIVCGFVATSLAYVLDPSYAYIPAATFAVPLTLIVAFLSYWISRYYRSITYQLTADEVVVERGVWWRMKHTVPYARIMSIDIIQGPISRKLGIATVDIYTAGYTGVSGGTGGPGSRRAEASIIHISNYAEVREKVLGIVRGKPLFSTRTQDTDSEALSELRKIRQLLERQALITNQGKR